MAPESQYGSDAAAANQTPMPPKWPEGTQRSEGSKRTLMVLVTSLIVNILLVGWVKLASDTASPSVITTVTNLTAEVSESPRPRPHPAVMLRMAEPQRDPMCRVLILGDGTKVWDLESPCTNIHFFAKPVYEVVTNLDGSKIWLVVVR